MWFAQLAALTEGHCLGRGVKEKAVSLAVSVWATLTPGALQDNVGRCQASSGVGGLELSRRSGLGLAWTPLWSSPAAAHD